MAIFVLPSGYLDTIRLYDNNCLNAEWQGISYLSQGIGYHHRDPLNQMLHK